MRTAPIKTMKLYSGADRVYNDVAALGLAPGEPLTTAALVKFDQLHYNGAVAIDEAVENVGIDGTDRVLDVGSGWGGPARYLAETTGASVTAVELQSDMNAVAADLTERCGLSNRVTHLCGDILDAPLPNGGFDVAVSWLAFYHIADHGALFARLASLLRPGGRLHVEDLFALKPFTEAERDDLSRFYAQCLPTLDAYVADLSEAGFSDIRFRDMTDDWRAFTHARLDGFRAARPAQIAIHGEAVVDDLDSFYALVVRLFDSGRLGGVRYSALRSRNPRPRNPRPDGALREGRSP